MSVYVPLRKLFQIINGFNKKELEGMKKIHELQHDLLPLIQHCYIESFYAKSKYFPKHLNSKDLTDAIVEAAFRFENEELGNLLYYLFYHRIPPIINSDSFDFDTVMMPITVHWNELQKIYSVLLGLSSKAINHLKDIDIMHLMNYAPLPLIDIERIEIETDSMKITRKRQQRVLQILTGINVRLGSFENVMQSLVYFEHDSIITNSMKSYGTYYLNETLLHSFTNNCVRLKKNENLSETEFINSVKEMTQSIYTKWKQCISEILDEKNEDNRSKYEKYLLCIENLSSQIRMRQSVPLGQYLLYILDECNIAPTWQIYENLWFAFNINDKYMPDSYNNDNKIKFLKDDNNDNDEKDIHDMDDNDDEDDYIFNKQQFHPFSFAQFEQDSDALSTVSIPMNYANILDRKYEELQSKYMTKDHIDYLIQNKRNEEAILMLNKYGELNELNKSITDKYKLNVIKQYMIEKELRNNYHNFYPFAISHWYPTSEPMNANYFVQRRIDPQNDNGVIVDNNWYKKNDIHIDKDKDVIFYIPHDIMKKTQYKTAILRYCKDEIFNLENEKFAHLQLEILPFISSVNKNKLESNSMKQNYDLFIIRGCQSLEDKLSIWSEIINLFEQRLEILSTVSCNDYPSISIGNIYPYSKSITFSHQLINFINKISIRYKCKIDANSISSFQFDNIPTFFIWKNILQETNENNLQNAHYALNEYLNKSHQSSSSYNNNMNKKPPILFINVSSKYHNTLNKMFYSDHTQIKRDLRYIRGTSTHKLISTDIFPKDKYDSSKGGIITITAPSRILRKRVYQQIFYTHPPSNDTNIYIHEKIDEEENDEWRDIDKMLLDLISSMEEEESLTIANALYFSRLKDNKKQYIKYKDWMMNLFKDELPIKSSDEMVKICQLIFSGLSMIENEFSHTMIGQIFYNVVINDKMLEIVNNTNNQSSICQLLYCVILSICNHSMHFRSLSITDFHRIRAAFLHCYCGEAINDDQGINENLSEFLKELISSDSYMLILLEYVYISCIMNNPNLSNHIIRFLNELLTLMIHETNIDSSIYSEFCTSTLDLLLIDIGSPQQQCANLFISMYQNMDKMLDITHRIYSEMDVETLKIILSELNPLEIEHINIPYGNIEILYKNIFNGCSLIGNIECIKLLLNRVDFLSKSYQTHNNIQQFDSFGIDDKFLNKICQNVWNYYNDIIGYDLEITAHSIMQLMECMLSGDKIWRHIISEDTVAQYAVLMAENELMSHMYSLKELIGNVENSSIQSIKEEHKFEALTKVLNDVDYSIYLQDPCHVYQHIQSVQ